MVKPLLAFLLLPLVGSLSCQVEFQVNWMYRVPDSLNQVTTSMLTEDDPGYKWAWDFDDVYFNSFPYLPQPVQLLTGGPIATPDIKAIVFQVDTVSEELVESYKFVNGESMVIGRYPIWFTIRDQHYLIGLETGADLILVTPERELCKQMIEGGWSDRCVAQLVMFNRFNEIEFISKEELGQLEVRGLD